ncbi:hypothetical protein ACLOJK_007584 [Asimina triloba]
MSTACGFRSYAVRGRRCRRSWLIVALFDAPAIAIVVFQIRSNAVNATADCRVRYCRIVEMSFWSRQPWLTPFEVMEHRTLFGARLLLLSSRLDPTLSTPLLITESDAAGL